MYYQRNYTFGGGGLTEGIKILLIANVAMFILTYANARIFYSATELLGIVPYDTWRHLRIWQVFSYLFLHGGLFHLGMNMLVLWMFGSDLERSWGTSFFLKYYFVTGVGAGVLTVLFQPMSTIPVIGASGAIYGILLAYGLMYPEREVYIYFLFPLKVKYFVLIIGAMAFFSSIGPGTGDNIAHITHLSGMLIGYYYLKRGGRGRGRFQKGGNLFDQAFSRLKDFFRMSKYQMRVDTRQSIHRKQYQAEVDALLEKISRYGYASLSDEEKERLLEASSKLSKEEAKQ
ncbi:MAG TPA: rhomboid family intramembrane serine protease [Candidatus Marinimicrobia bacterium]|nr:rhomboid family intramembrane serine protease [Candidatus Neomarinimicrobiota bacterium]